MQNRPDYHYHIKNYLTETKGEAKPEGGYEFLQMINDKTMAMFALGFDVPIETLDKNEIIEGAIVAHAQRLLGPAPNKLLPAGISVDGNATLEIDKNFIAIFYKSLTLQQVKEIQTAYNTHYWDVCPHAGEGYHLGPQHPYVFFNRESFIKQVFIDLVMKRKPEKTSAEKLRDFTDAYAKSRKTLDSLFRPLHSTKEEFEDKLLEYAGRDSIAASRVAGAYTLENLGATVPSATPSTSEEKKEEKKAEPKKEAPKSASELIGKFGVSAPAAATIQIHATATPKTSPKMTIGS